MSSATNQTFRTLIDEIIDRPVNVADPHTSYCIILKYLYKILKESVNDNI